MKKILSVLMLCLIAISSLYSQKLLSDTCCVPCSSLKKALIVRQERIYCGAQLGFARDSIFNLQEIILSKDTIIQHRDSAIILLEQNQEKYKEVVGNKDLIITAYSKEIKSLKASKSRTHIVAGLAILLTIFLSI